MPDMLKKIAATYRNRRGAALVLAIFTSVILTVLAVGLVEIVRVEIIASRSALNRLQARYLAKAGFNLARSLLMYEDEQDTDGTEDVWFTLQDEPPLDLGEGSCHMAVIDACSLINVNTADEGVLSVIIGDLALAQAVAAWRTENGPFRSLGELGRVEGMSKDRLAELAKLVTTVSLERNVSAEGEERVNVNTPDPSQMVRLLGIRQSQAQSIIHYRRLQPDDLLHAPGEVLRADLPRSVVKEIMDKITVSEAKYNSGRVNLNTASREVLLALPGASPQFVDTLIARREEEGGGLRSIGELLGFPGISDEDFISLSGLTCTKSSTYIIEASAQLEGKPVRRTLQGVVVRQPGPVAPIASGWKETFRPTFIQTGESG